MSQWPYAETGERQVTNKLTVTAPSTIFIQRQRDDSGGGLSRDGAVCFRVMDGDEITVHRTRVAIHDSFTAVSVSAFGLHTCTVGPLTTYISAALQQ